MEGVSGGDHHRVSSHYTVLLELVLDKRREWSVVSCFWQQKRSI